MPKTALTAILIPSFLMFTSCSMFSGSSQTIAILPSHPRAEVFVDGAPVGRGAQTVSLSKRNSHTIMAKCGNSVGIAHVDRSISTTGMLDLVGGVLFLVPLLGLFAPGFWRLGPTTVVVGIPDDEDCVAQSDRE